MTKNVCIVITFILTCLVASPASSYVPDPYTLALYHFDTASGGVTPDVAGGHDASLQGNASITSGRQGKFGEALYLDGAGDYVVTQNIHIPGSMAQGTVEMWVKLTAIDDRDIGLSLGDPRGYNNDDPIAFVINNPSNWNGISFGVWERWGPSYGTWHMAQSGVSAALLVGKWHHIAGTWGPAGVQVWIDGVLSGSNPYTGSGNTPNYPVMTVGSDSWGSDVAGYIDELRVSSIQRSDFDVHSNTAPIAEAGPDQSVDEGSTVLLSSSSTDPDGDALTLSWTQVAGSTVSLNASGSKNPTFVAPLVPAGGETLTFQLKANDGVASSTDTVNITVKNVNHYPVADAGDFQTVKEGAPVILNGTHSYDSDGEPIAYSWVQVSGTQVELSGRNTAAPTFTAPAVGREGDTLRFALTVNDGIDSSQPSEVLVIIEDVNHPALAEAGATQTKNEGSLVALDGSGTRDPDGDPITLSWRQVAGPPVVLSDPSNQKPYFTAPLVGPGGATIRFQLVAADDLGAATSDEVMINVLNIYDPPRCDFARSSVSSIWPANHKLVPVQIVGVTDPAGKSFALTVTGVTQDEPVNGLGDGDTSPDAVVQGAETLLRAERAGEGNGRVYRLSFIAVDNIGESCTGVVSVCVPHDRKGICMDDGLAYDATNP